MRRRSFAAALSAITVSAACVGRRTALDAPAEKEQAARIRAEMERLRPLHDRQPRSEAGDWRADHAEPGQTLEQYLGSQPRLPDATRKLLYVQPLGELSTGQQAIVAKTAEYLGVVYALEVRTRPNLALTNLPTTAERRRGLERQVLTTHVLTALLEPQLPTDAMAMIGLTATDLWPGAGWNFVFGQAMLKARVGVWSLARLGNADGSDAEFRRTLRRTLKIAVHEVGHMFSIRHCIAYRCVMAGTNGLAELDRTPLSLCPDDLAKLLWATGDDAALRLRRMREFSRREGLEEEASFFDRAARALDG